MRQRYTMTQAQYDRLLEAAQPVPYIMVGGSMPSNPQERANRAWRALGTELGFDGMTVRPVGSDPKTFSAEPVATVVKDDAPPAEAPKKGPDRTLDGFFIPAGGSGSEYFPGVEAAIAASKEVGGEVIVTASPVGDQARLQFRVRLPAVEL